LIERPFYERYPSQYLEKDGGPVFSEDMYIGELHDQYLKEEYFLPVMSIKKNPRYKNKREMDPQVK